MHPQVGPVDFDYRFQWPPRATAGTRERAAQAPGRARVGPAKQPLPAQAPHGTAWTTKWMYLTNMGVKFCGHCLCQYQCWIFFYFLTLNFIEGHNCNADSTAAGFQDDRYHGSILIFLFWYQAPNIVPGFVSYLSQEEKIKLFKEVRQETEKKEITRRMAVPHINVKLTLQICIGFFFCA